MGHIDPIIETLKVDFCAPICYNRGASGNDPNGTERRKKKIMTKTTYIFLANDSTTYANDVVAFSNIGTAFTYILDSHADMNPEGAALMLETTDGLVPATLKAVKAHWWAHNRFVSVGADNASTVAKIASKLEGAIKACVSLGIDPSNVGKVGELQAELKTAQATLDSDDDDGFDGVTFTIIPTKLHKRGYKSDAS